MELDLVTNVRVGSGTSICEIRVCVPDCGLEGNFTLSISNNPWPRIWLIRYEDETRHAVAQLVEALRYKPEGRRFDSRCCHWNFSWTLSFLPHRGPGVDSASNRNEYQEYFVGGKVFRCVGLTTLPPSCADCLEIWEPHPAGTLRACPGL